MSYRTILVHVDRSGNAAARIRLAAALAQGEKAHLVGSAMTGVPRYMCAGSPFDVTGVMIAECQRAASKRADEALARFDEITGAAGLQSVEHRRTE